MVVRCKYTKLCGGCISVNDDYSKSLSEKKEYLQKLFGDIGKVQDVVGNFYPYKYRNKLQLAFTQFKGKTIMGFFEEGTTKVVDIDGCILNGDWSNTLISILREYISRFKIRGYIDGSGILRYAHARCIENKLQLTLCVTTDNFPGRDWLYKKLQEKFSQVSLYLNINRRTDRAVFDNRFKFIAGSKYLSFDFMGISVSLEPASFLQVNLPMAEKIYKKALDLLEVDNNTTVIDLYSGIGITSIMFSRFAKNVIAIEENSKAVSNAIYMSKINNAGNIKFVSGKCEENLKSIDGGKDTVVFVDPARMGLDNAVIEKIKNINPRKIVYMSCNPETCVRDIKQIYSDNKYDVSDIIPYDVFACTKHVEVLVCLQRQV